MKIVQFESGRFAIRKWSISKLAWVYLDQHSQKFPWVGKNSPFFRCCLHYSAEEAREAYKGWRKVRLEEVEKERLRKSRKVVYKGAV